MVRVAIVVCCVLSLAACGSRVSVAEVEATRGATGGSSGGLAGAASQGGAIENGGIAPGAASPALAAAGEDTTAGGPLDSRGGTPPPAGTGPTAGGNGVTGAAARECTSLKDQPGITADTITIGNVADISGPVPGLFEAARQATQAYVKYFNDTSDLCGRKLDLITYDGRTDASAVQQVYARACTDVFAMVGSMSGFDQGGVAETEACGLPDIHSVMSAQSRRDCSVCFASRPVQLDMPPRAVPEFFAKRAPASVKRAAILFVDTQTSAAQAESFRRSYERAGWSVEYFQGIAVSEFNYAPYVQAMKDRDIDFVVYVGAYQFTVRLQQAMAQQGFDPEYFLQDSLIYQDDYVEQAGEAGEGTYVWTMSALFEDRGNKEMALYRAYLEAVAPGATPDTYGLMAWSATRLFVEQAAALGEDLDRASLVRALSKVKDWTSNGLHAPQQVGKDEPGECYRVIQLQGGVWRPVSDAKYFCAPINRF